MNKIIWKAKYYTCMCFFEHLWFWAPGSSDSLPLTHKSISEGRHWFLIRLTNVVLVHPKGVGRRWGHGCVLDSHVIPHQTQKKKHFFVELALSLLKTGKHQTVFIENIQKYMSTCFYTECNFNIIRVNIPIKIFSWFEHWYEIMIK